MICAATAGSFVSPALKEMISELSSFGPSIRRSRQDWVARRGRASAGRLGRLHPYQPTELLLLLTVPVQPTCRLAPKRVAKIACLDSGLRVGLIVVVLLLQLQVDLSPMPHK